MTPRDLALEALNIQSRVPGFYERYIEDAFRRYPGLSKRDRALAVHLVQGVIRWRLRLDWIINQNIRFQFKKIESTVLNILRIALYQIFFMDRVPQSAAVNEAVKQVKAVSRERLAGFVNGILREICRQGDRVSFPERGKELSRHLSIVYSYPLWLVDKWIRELGESEAERLLDAGNRLRGMVIRTNILRTSREELIKDIRRLGIGCKATTYAPAGIEMEDGIGALEEVEPFREGLFQVQGEAAQICSHLLSPEPGEIVLDMCAGLGGKSTHVAELMGDKGVVISLDLNHSRLRSLLETSRRLGLSCLVPVVADAISEQSSLFRRKFDKVLVDAPCSALGTISRHPDTKWVREESDPERMANIQLGILEGTAPLIQKGGCLLYVTCTVSMEENEGLAYEFLKRHNEFVLEDLAGHGPSWAEGLIDDKGMFKVYPHIHGMDGFFGALFRRM